MITSFPICLSPNQGGQENVLAPAPGLAQSRYSVNILDTELYLVQWTHFTHGQTEAEGANHLQCLNANDSSFQFFLPEMDVDSEKPKLCSRSGTSCKQRCLIAS